MADVTPQYAESNLIGTLNSAISASDTTITATFTDKVSGVARSPQTNTKLYVIDKGSESLPNPNYELVLAGSVSTVSGVTTLSSCTRGIAFYGTSVAGGTGNAHAASAEIGIVDNHLLTNLLASILDGTNSPPANWNMGTHKITNMGDPTSAQDAATMGYVDGVSIAGAPNASTTTKGITKMSVAPVSATSPISVGDNDPRLTYNDGTASASNKSVTQSGYQKGAEIVATTGGSANAYTLTLSPAIAAYTTGQRFFAKIHAANTNTSTMAVNGLSALTIKKVDGSNVSSGDLRLNKYYEFLYDGTNLQVIGEIFQNAATADAFFAALTASASQINAVANGSGGSVTTHSHPDNIVYATGNGSTSQSVAHGLGAAPNLSEIRATLSGSGVLRATSWGDTSNKCIFERVYNSGGSDTAEDGTDATKAVNVRTGSTAITATVTVDATNVNFTWSTASNTGVHVQIITRF